MNKYTVVLIRDVYIADENEYVDPYIAYVGAEDPKKAVPIAKEEAYQADLEYIRMIVRGDRENHGKPVPNSPEDYHVAVVLEGHPKILLHAFQVTQGF